LISMNLYSVFQKVFMMTPTSCLRDFSLEKTRLVTAHPLVFWLGISSAKRMKKPAILAPGVGQGQGPKLRVRVGVSVG
jgi:hypothetical protein